MKRKNENIDDEIVVVVLLLVGEEEQQQRVNPILIMTMGSILQYYYNVMMYQ